LTEAERRQMGEFKCPDCGTLISKLEDEATAETRTWREQITDLVKSKRAWKWMATGVAFNLLAERFFDGILHPLLPPYPRESYVAHDWQDTLYHLVNVLIVYPIGETLLLGLIISSLARIQAPKFAQMLLATLACCAIDGRHHWQHGVAVVPGFLVMSWAYSHWRQRSWLQALFVVFVMHAGYNGVLYTELVANQIHRDIVSLQTTGSLFGLDNAYHEYEEGVRLDLKEDLANALAKLEDASERDPKNADILNSLAIVQMKMNRLAAAQATITKALFVDPGKFLAWETQSMLFYREKRYGEAVDAGLKAVAAAPDEYRESVSELMTQLRGKFAAPQNIAVPSAQTAGGRQN
jgi:hypothetical protein